MWRTGCNELLFNPFVQWWRKVPIAHQIHRFMWSNAPLHYKFSMLAYMFSYCELSFPFHACSHFSDDYVCATDGIAAAITISIMNYVLLGFQLPVDGFYQHSFEVWLATTVVFFGSGNVGYTLLEYRLGQKPLVSGTVCYNMRRTDRLFSSARCSRTSRGCPSCALILLVSWRDRSVSDSDGVQFLLLWRTFDPRVAGDTCRLLLV